MPRHYVNIELRSPNLDARPDSIRAVGHFIDESDLRSIFDQLITSYYALGAFSVDPTPTLEAEGDED